MPVRRSPGGDLKTADNIPSRANATRIGENRTRIVNRTENSAAEQEPVLIARAIRVVTHDFPARVDPITLTGNSPREIDGNETWLVTCRSAHGEAPMVAGGQRP